MMCRTHNNRPSALDRASPACSCSEARATRGQPAGQPPPEQSRTTCPLSRPPATVETGDGCGSQHKMCPPQRSIGRPRCPQCNAHMALYIQTPAQYRAVRIWPVRVSLSNTRAPTQTAQRAARHAEKSDVLRPLLRPATIPRPPRAASPERKTRTPSLLQPMNCEQKVYVPGSGEDPRALLTRFLRPVPPARPPQWQVDPFLLPAQNITESRYIRAPAPKEEKEIRARPHSPHRGVYFCQRIPAPRRVTTRRALAEILVCFFFQLIILFFRGRRAAPLKVI